MTRDERFRLARAVLAERAGDVLVMVSTGFHMIDLSNPVDHMTGFQSMGPSLLLLPSKGDATLLATPASDAARAPDAGLAIETVFVDDLGAAVDVWLAGRELRSVATVGFGALPHRLAAQLRALFPSSSNAIDAAFYQATGVKTDDEIAAARRATVIAEQGYIRLKEIARPGVKECDLAIELNLFMRELGANDSFLLLSAGARSKAVMPSSERPLAVGDLILSELSPSVDGQFVQICRTVGLGGDFDVVAEKYALLASAMRAGIAAVRPGVRMGGVCEAVDDFLSSAGYAQFARPPFIRRRGHGLGSGSVWPGDVSQDNDARLAEGMLFMVHPNQFLPETGYMMCGEPVLVTSSGAEILTQRMSAFDVIEL